MVEFGCRHVLGIGLGAFLWISDTPLHRPAPPRRACGGPRPGMGWGKGGHGGPGRTCPLAGPRARPRGGGGKACYLPKVDPAAKVASDDDALEKK